MRSTAITSLVGLAVAMAFSGAALAAQTSQTSPTFGSVTSQQAQSTASQQGSVFGQSVRTRALTNRRHHLHSHPCGTAIITSKASTCGTAIIT